MACQTRDIMLNLKQREVFIVEISSVCFHVLNRLSFKITEITFVRFFSCFFRVLRFFFIVKLILFLGLQDEFEDIQVIIQSFIFFLKILNDAQICDGGKSMVTILARTKFDLGFGGINEIIEREGLDIFLDKNFVILFTSRRILACLLSGILTAYTGADS